jgi:Type II secretion system (T2SS), protein E, N-terminal domain
MPLLSRFVDSPEGDPLERRGVHPGLLVECANRACTSGWLHLWRSRTTPIFENGWTCSPECTAARVRAAVMRESGGLEGPRTDHRHRVPLGLLMLEQGWITQAQLRRALEAQKRAGTGRLGHWLVRQGAAHESSIARALAVQWSCPVLTLEGHDPAEVSAVIPRLFVDAFGALPLRVTAGRTLFLGFEESLDPPLALAIERMTGMRVESGIAQETSFRPAHARMLKAKFPSIELVESVSETAAAFALARSIERARPIASRLVRVHECLWLRMWQRPPRGLLAEDGTIRDVVCSIGML